ncbi:MAG: hypothetical protein ACE5I3_14270 [Phycisphaerae bacterium]
MDGQSVCDLAYTYDPLGNRTSYTEGTADPLYYCTNELNQYTHTKTDPADTCPPANPAETFIYDADGNLTSDGSFTYEWDAENRLTPVIPKNPVDESKKLKFTYDYMGRRVRKQVFDWDPTLNGGAGGWTDTPETDLRYVYYNWLLLTEYQGEDNTKLRKYVWGLDPGSSGVSPDLGPAGGIRGLLAVRDVPPDQGRARFARSRARAVETTRGLPGARRTRVLRESCAVHGGLPPFGQDRFFGTSLRSFCRIHGRRTALF